MPLSLLRRRNCVVPPFYPWTEWRGPVVPKHSGIKWWLFWLVFSTRQRSDTVAQCSVSEQKRKLMQCCRPVLSEVIGGTHYGPTCTGQCFKAARQEGIRSLYKGPLSQWYADSTGWHVVGLLMMYLYGGHFSCGHLTRENQQIIFLWNIKSQKSSGLGHVEKNVYWCGIRHTCRFWFKT